MGLRGGRLHRWWQGSRSFPTVAMSIVMALGIMIGGAFQQVRFLREDVGPVATAVGVLILLVLFIGYLRDVVRGVFFDRHIGHPIASFAAGTWVAGTSVAVITLVNELPALRDLAYFLFSVNCFILPAYLALIVRNYWQLWIAVFRLKLPERIVQVHGVLLLACVATQSMVVAASVLWGDEFSRTAYVGLLLLGSLLYVLGLVLIITRFVRHPTRNLADHWNNTNCIIHGAMSITGLASARSHVVDANLVVLIWLYVLAMFVAIEAIEIIRGVQRVRRYGWGKGIFTYSIGQWARNFTFGMLLDFTMNLPWRESFLAGDRIFEPVYHAILSEGKYVVFALFLVEVVLYLKQFRTNRAHLARSEQA